jgi:hypothetical protein
MKPDENQTVEGAVLVAVLVRDVEHVARKYRLLKWGTAEKQKQDSHINCWWYRAN